MLKKFIKTIFALIIFLTMGLTGNCKNTVAYGLLDELNISASASLDYFSQYIWRGFALETDPVTQPAFNLSGYGLTVSYWGSYDADNNDYLNGDEQDTIVDYTYNFNETYSASFGHTYYDFPGTNTYSKEFYLGFGAKKIPIVNFPATLTFKFYRDYGDPNHGGGLGNYFVWDFAYSKLILKNLGITFNAGLHIGYNDGLFINGHGGVLAPSLGFAIPLTKNLTFSQVVRYSHTYHDLNNVDDGNQKNRWIGGLSLGCIF